MSPAPDILVAIPARDEAARVEACLGSVLAAIRLARARGMIEHATVAVAAHCCRDETARLARAVLGPAVDVAWLVWETDEAMPVGAVRAGLIRRATRPEPVEGPMGSSTGSDHQWLFSTDADSVVPPTWIRSGLRLAESAAVDMIVGLVELTDVSPSIRVAHDRLVQAGVHRDGSHDHVYAANLAIRLSTYAAVGGFPAVTNGEEHALLGAVRAAGHPVLRTIDWRVTTSGRTHGRARDGLADLLGRLAQARIAELDRPA